MSEEIKMLPLQDYSSEQREQKIIVGQKAAIRFFNPQDAMDMFRLSMIMRNRNVRKWMEQAVMSDAEIIDWAKEKGVGKKKNYLLFTISGSPTTREILMNNDVGEVQGFVYFYRGRDEQKRITQLVNNGFLPNDSRRDGFEISVAINPDAPSHQAASAIRQACVEANEMKGKNDEASVEPNLPIIAFIDRKNTKSQFAFEAAGFVRKGEMKYEEESKKADLVYVLDWAKLNEKLHEKSDVIFQR